MDQLHALICQWWAASTDISESLALASASESWSSFGRLSGLDGMAKGVSIGVVLSHSRLSFSNPPNPENLPRLAATDHDHNSD